MIPVITILTLIYNTHKINHKLIFSGLFYLEKMKQSTSVEITFINYLYVKSPSIQIKCVPLHRQVLSGMISILSV